MAVRLLPIVLTIFLLATICVADSTDESSMDGSSEAFPLSDSEIDLSPASAPPPPSSMTQSQSQELQSPMAILESILSSLGFQELAMAVPSLSDSAFRTWSGPSTVFAPTDDSIRSCTGSCSVPQLLREHIVPGLFSFEYLKNLAFGTKLETMNTGRCITVTSAEKRDENGTLVYIGGVEITHPDFFNNGMIVVHRLEGFISPLSPFSCNIERFNSMSFPQSDENRTSTTQNRPSPAAVMRLMLRDAMLRLHNNGFSVVSLALKVKYPEIMNLQNLTVFALDDTAIFAGGHGYLNNFRFHIIPNQMLMSSDLMKLPAGTTLPTLDRDQTLTITTTGNGAGQLRINYVRLKTADVVYNLKIAVHSIFLAFPHIHPATQEFGGANSVPPPPAPEAFDAAAVVSDPELFKLRDGAKNGRGTKSNRFGSSVVSDPVVFKSVDKAKKAPGSCSASDKGKNCDVSPAPLKHKESL
ncbi:hypothetical protein ACHQM5_024503 [Ranunculus cassubicifolius]